MQNCSLTPQVHWAQRHHELYLRVELSDVQDPEVTITENVLHFKAQGHGAKGDNVYQFQIEFLEPVKTKPICKVTQRQLNLTVKKAESLWWERLTKQEKRPLFLAPDFDRWLDESDAEMELKAKERYPFYMLSCIDVEWKVLTWIRYSIWIPLYPLGVLAEAVAVIQAIPIFNSTGRFSLQLPSPLNFAIPFSVFLQLYLVLLFLGPFVNFRHLYKQRKRHLGPKKRKMH
ncbi:hypothetical protein JRQ81_006764 [Phrynocephalus forsythii]|uniref:Very-long-chain (3R)-3-hydroxyacyl-CoA dehydratase n=1 Tax=Phrynocephalus forsythii TaxID=171643 RepID=A0A9Q0XFK1_9SAUR|nr:hypothetical protein JRQ81_006764 [Phrynocephalus forsythii]